MNLKVFVDPPPIEPVYDLGTPALIAVGVVGLVLIVSWLRRGARA